MSKLDIRHQVRIQANSVYWITVEDIYLDVGCPGLTISYWESKDGGEERIDHICISEDSALAVADAIYKLFKGWRWKRKHEPATRLHLQVPRRYQAHRNLRSNARLVQ